MYTSFLTTELLYWIEEARSYASIARTYTTVPGFTIHSLDAARTARAAIARMTALLRSACERTATAAAC